MDGTIYLFLEFETIPYAELGRALHITDDVQR